MTVRVAYVCTDPGVPPFGSKGASVHVQAVLRALVRRGAEVHLLTLRPGGEPGPELAAVQVRSLPRPGRDTDRAGREVLLREIDEQVAPVLDLLHAECPLTLVYERYSLWGGTAMAWAATHAVPSLLEVNAPLVEEQATHRVLVDRPRAERTAVAAVSAAGAVLCVSEPVKAWAARHTADPSRVHTLSNGVDTAHVRPTTRAVAPAAGISFTVGFVGSLKPWHGLGTLADAFVSLAADPTYRLLVVGDGPAAEQLHARLARGGVMRQVEMTGSVPHAQVPALLGRMDVAVAPYPALNGFYFSPLKLYEYLAAGVPVVASAVGDLPAVLDHGRLGLLVAPGDAGALSEAVAALRGDAERRARLRRAGRRRAVQRHDWSRVVERALSLARVGTPVSVEVLSGEEVAGAAAR